MQREIGKSVIIKNRYFIIDNIIGIIISNIIETVKISDIPSIVFVPIEVRFKIAFGVNRLEMT